MKMKVLRMYDDVKMPVKANLTDSGFDVFVHSIHDCDSRLKVLFPGDRVLVKTGLKVTVGPGYEIQVRPRSGNALKKGLTVLNSPGTIDEAYRGEAGIIIINLSDNPQSITVGDKIAQLVVCPVILAEIEEVKELDSTVRDVGGFGHTGN